MNRLPLRLRLTLVFALAMAVVLAATGAFLYFRVGDSLLQQLDDSLRARAQVLAAAIAEGELEQPLSGGEEEFAQVIDAEGSVVAATPGFGTPLLSRQQQAAAGSAGLLVEAEVSPPGEDEQEPARLLTLPLGSGVVIVGATLEDRADVLDGLLAQLVIGGPVALLLASGAGYLLAGAALRPVEAMRRGAAEISADTSGERLPLPTARDEIHRLGTTLNAMIDRLDAGLRRERRFVADASHELRTPLALLQAEIELALRRPRNQAELRDALQSISEEVDRLARLAEDLLVLASTEEGGLPLRAARFPVRELLDSVARRFAARAAAANTRIEIGDTAALELEADRLRLEQALGNLVDNAFRHGTGPITLDASVANGMVKIRVSDRGPGFPRDFLAHAFERFTRPDDARTAGGAGLGLAIVDAIARAHGGEAGAHNRPDARGADVVVSIPIRG